MFIKGLITAVFIPVLIKLLMNMFLKKFPGETAYILNLQEGGGI